MEEIIQWKKIAKNNFKSPEGDFETRIALVIALSLIIFVRMLYEMKE